MNDQTGIIERIKAMQRVRGMSIAALSEATDTPYTTLQRYLASKRSMPVGTLQEIAVVLEVSTDWLLFGKPAPMDLEKLAKALEAHDDLRQVSGEKLSRIDYAKVFAKAYEDWNRPEPFDLIKEKLARMGIKLTVQKKSEPDEI